MSTIFSGLAPAAAAAIAGESNQKPAQYNREPPVKKAKTGDKGEDVRRRDYGKPGHGEGRGRKFDLKA